MEDDIKLIRSVRSILDHKDDVLGLARGSTLLMCDANTRWLQHGALRMVPAMSDFERLYTEQPCLTYKKCLAVRDKCESYS